MRKEQRERERERERESCWRANTGSCFVFAVFSLRKISPTRDFVETTKRGTRILADETARGMHATGTCDQYAILGSLSLSLSLCVSLSLSLSLSVSVSVVAVRRKMGRLRVGFVLANVDSQLKTK